MENTSCPNHETNEADVEEAAGGRSAAFRVETAADSECVAANSECMVWLLGCHYEMLMRLRSWWGQLDWETLGQ